MCFGNHRIIKEKVDQRASLMAIRKKGHVGVEVVPLLIFGGPIGSAPHQLPRLVLTDHG